ncbi:MAG: hypothetical protein GKC53_02355 [Neisseriaceae bacterium]|nr:MAG: hypothetical protein GKC53_02355 [Neisseriaceae bacterium]
MSQTGRGGKRTGAGRKKGTGIFKEPTVVKRVPLSAIPVIDDFLDQLKNLVPSERLPKNSFLLNNFSHKIPIVSSPVRSRSTEPNIGVIDLNEYLSGNDRDIIGVHAEDNSMVDAGINAGDLLILKTKVYPKEKDIIVIQLNDSFTVKRLHFDNGHIVLMSENTLEKYPIIQLKQDDKMKIIGIVISIIKKLS